MLETWALGEVYERTGDSKPPHKRMEVISGHLWVLSTSFPQILGLALWVSCVQRRESGEETCEG